MTSPSRSAASRLTAPIVAGLLVGLALSFWPVAGARGESGLISAPPVALAAFDGQWKRLEAPEEDRARISSIDAAIGDLSWLLRKMAGPILRSTTRPPAEMAFVWDGVRLHQRVDSDGGEFTRPVDFDGEPVELIDSRGEPFLSHWSWSSEGLRVHWRQHQAHGTNLYRVDPRDQTLRVVHTIQVTAIDDVAPIVYSSRFRRAGLPPVSSIGPAPQQSLAADPIER